MSAAVERAGLALGPGIRRAAVVAVVVGAAALALGFVAGLGAATFAALTASWLFAAGLAAGTLAVSAAVHLARGRRWSGVAPALTDAGTAFFVPAFVLLAVIVIGNRLWMPRSVFPDTASAVLFVVRNLAATAILFAAGRRYADQARRGVPAANGWAVVYLLLYAVTLTIWAMDLVMSFRQGAPSTIIPAYYFMGAFLCGIAWIALLGSGRDAFPPTVRRDLSWLIFAFSAFWAYLLWSSYLPIWYANLPEETGELLIRWSGAWRFLSFWMLAAVFLIPFGLFFPEAARRGRGALATGATIVLAGFVGERFLLVFPSLKFPPNPLIFVLAVAVAAGVIGLFVLAVGTRLAAEEHRAGG